MNNWRYFRTGLLIDQKEPEHRFKFKIKLSTISKTPDCEKSTRCINIKMNFEYTVRPILNFWNTNDTYASSNSAEISSCSLEAPVTKRSGRSTADCPWPGGCNQRFSFNSNSYSFLEFSFSLFKIQFNNCMIQIGSISYQ